jgi:hypothetical protein
VSSGFIPDFVPDAPSGGGGFRPDPQMSKGGIGGGAPYDYESLKTVAERAGAGQYAGIMARIALAESGGNPQSNANHKTSYQERGKTYYPEGLWQISTVHGYKENQFDVLNNAHRAVELFKAQGFGPWEASRHGGAGGGWGQYLESEGLAPNARTPSESHMGGGANEQFSSGFIAAAGGFRPDPTPDAQGFIPDSTPSGGFRPDPTPPPKYQTAGLGDFPKRVDKDITALETNKPWEAHSLVGKAVAAAREAFYYGGVEPMNALFNVLGTTSRLGMETVTGELGHQLGTAGGDLAHGDIKGFGQHIWRLVGDVSDAHMAKLTAGTEHALHGWLNLPEHAAIDHWVQNSGVIPKGARGTVSTILKGGEDFAAQAVVDPLTFSGIGDVVKGAELLRYLNPLFAGGRFAAKTYKAAEELGLPGFEHIKALRDLYANTVDAVAPTLKNLFTVRPDLEKLSPAMRQIRMAQENSAGAASAAASKVEAQYLRGADDAKAGEIFDRYFSQYGSPKNAAAANKRLTKDLQFDGTPSGALREQSLKTARAEFVNRLHPGETDAALFQRRARILDDFRKTIDRKLVNDQTAELVRKAPEDGSAITEDDKKYIKDFGAKMHTGESYADTLARQLTGNPIATRLRNWTRKAIMWNPLPHAFKNVGTLAYLAGGPEVVVKALWYMAKGGIGEENVLRQTRIGARAFYQRLEQAAPRAGLGKVSDQIYGASANSMQYMEDAWRQALLDQVDRTMPTRKGTAFEAEDEWRKGALVSDKVGDYHNQIGLVRTLEAMGGPFIAFRLGIVPRKVMQSIRENPQRALAIARAQYDLNANRHGKQKNVARIGGPVSDFSEFLYGSGSIIPGASPFLYGLNSVLPMSGATSQDWFWQQGPVTIANRAAQTYVPFVSAGTDLWRTTHGQAMPGQSMSLTDKLTVQTLALLGIYFHKQPSHKLLQETIRGIKKKPF